MAKRTASLTIISTPEFLGQRPRHLMTSQPAIRLGGDTATPKVGGSRVIPSPSPSSAARASDCRFHFDIQRFCTCSRAAMRRADKCIAANGAMQTRGGAIARLLDDPID